ncbi:MAG: calcium-translocating P-type ATPase, PMCA-type [Rikenellaceae bacterium]|jgi:Ca2+-transporting ATPase|nr:calcium-translocating P-type ATPase, PMCA-type [Rikenellaceae bacterium]
MGKMKINGLTSQEAEQSRQRHGSNVITPVASISAWKLLGEKFADPVIRILMVAAALSLGIGIMEGEYFEPVGIIVAILLATGVAFWFEYDAKKKFDLLNTVSDDVAVKVVRDGCVCEVARRDVVVGDVVMIENGDEVPADGELLEALSLLINESTLTGEPAVTKTTDPEQFKQDTTYPSNVVLRSTTVVEGSATMRVTAVGDNTEYGKVAASIAEPATEKTPLTKQLEKLSSLISRVGSAMAVAMFVILTVRGLVWGPLLEGGWTTALQGVLKYFMASVAVIVMAVPEGLPMSITLSLAMNMRRMLRNNNLVRKMHACETMGAVTVICTDKTGTLTLNRMQVAAMERTGALPDELFHESIAANSTAFLDAEGKPIGNPTEGALLIWLDRQGVDYGALRDGATIVDRMTFSTERKMMATLVASPTAGRRMLYVKGAPEIVMARCAGVDREHCEALLRDYQGRAMRTLGFAVAETDALSCEEALSGELQLVAIAAIADPVREDVPAAIGRCFAAGIAVKIVTGDTTVTACEIARQIGLWGEGDTLERNHISGAEFEATGDEELLGRVGNIKVMSRARPLDKQRLVRLLQQLGEVVAVTGDGTNDAPALNMAQVGLSMGSGTSVAKEASDVTLLDDSFATIATAVMWGRSIYRNIQRFVLFQLTVNVSALLVVFVGSVFGREMPLTITQILWINLIMDTFAAMALASLPARENVMRERPRRSSEFMITPLMQRMIFWTGGLFAAALLGLLFVWGADADRERLSLFFTLFVMMQVWNLFNARSYAASHGPLGGFGRGMGSGWFMAVVGLIVVGQVLIVNFGDEFFRTVPVTLANWGIAVGATAFTLAFGWLFRERKTER